MKSVSVILAVYLLFGSLFPKNDFSQMLRLHELWAHYQEHLASSDEADWQSFLCEHFIHPELHDSDHNEPHHELPFMSISASSFFLLPQSLPENTPADEREDSLLPEYAFSHTIPFISPLFQPPSLV